MVKPLFLMGIPKTGTTLLQRVLASHNAISSSPEPWALLPPLVALQDNSMVAEYGARSCNTALHRMLDELPHGRADYLRAVGAFGASLYHDLAEPGVAYFLDKTPRYHLIAEDLVDAFPEARFIFLWRNPLSVISSTILHNGDRLAGMRFAEFDLLRGYANLLAAEKKASERGLTLRYEDFVLDPQGELRQVMQFLDLELDEGQLSDFAKMKFAGGDRNGIDRETIETGSIERWRGVLNRPARRSYAMRLLGRVDEEGLTAHLYDKREMIAALASLPVRWTPSSVTEFTKLAAADLYVKVQGQAIRSGNSDALLY